MAQAKGVLPTKGEDREVLYANAKTCGYFIGVRLTENLRLDELTQWLSDATAAVDVLVARAAPKAGAVKGEKVAAVAVGFAPSFFQKLTAAGSTLELPVGVRPELTPQAGWFPNITALEVDAMFYVASVHETRVNEFLARINSSPVVERLQMDRGYQTSDETEPFGYKDGERNIPRSERPDVVYIDTDGDQGDEPAWADGGTYMVTMRILQRPEAFASLPSDDERDAVMGRTKDGKRLDLQGAGVHPHDEPGDVPNALPPTSHVRKAGPRGAHDDTRIFRRGLPFMEVVDGELRVGLHFCSFQANPTQFDVVFNDWMMNPHFPPQAGSPGPDALLVGSGPGGQFTEILHAGLFFVPPTHREGLAEALRPRATRGKPTHGRLVVNKSVTDPAEPTKRLERGGFTFRVVEQDGATVPGAEFTTASTGRGVCPVELELGKSYRLLELASPHPLDGQPEVPFVMEKINQHLPVPNQLPQSSGGYGTR